VPELRDEVCLAGRDDRESDPNETLDVKALQLAIHHTDCTLVSLRNGNYLPRAIRALLRPSLPDASTLKLLQHELDGRSLLF
jgi:hypothetical protein